METKDNQFIVYEAEDVDGDKIQIIGYPAGDGECGVVLRVWNFDQRASYGVILDPMMMVGISGSLMGAVTAMVEGDLIDLTEVEQ